MNFNRTTQAFANQQDNLQQSVALLGPVVQKAGETFTDLNASLPGINAWATAILPGVRETGPTIDAAFPWVEQTRQLVSPAELQGLVNELRPTVANLASVTDESLNLIPQLDLLNRCAINVVLPTGDIPINDGFLATGVPNYKEAWQAIVGLSSESQNFDGNGIYTRFQAGGGAEPVNTGPSPSGILYGNATAKILGTQPKRPAAPPPKKSNVACYKNRCPTSTTRRSGPGRENRNPQAPAGLPRDHLPGPWWPRAWPATYSRTSGSTCPRGCRSSARASTRSTPSSPPPRRSCLVRVRR